MLLDSLMNGLKTRWLEISAEVNPRSVLPLVMSSCRVPQTRFQSAERIFKHTKNSKSLTSEKLNTIQRMNNLPNISSQPSEKRNYIKWDFRAPKGSTRRVSPLPKPQPFQRQQPVASTRERRITSQLMISTCKQPSLKKITPEKYGAQRQNLLLAKWHDCCGGVTAGDCSRRPLTDDSWPEASCNRLKFLTHLENW